VKDFNGFKPRQDLSGYTAIPNEWFDVVLRQVDNLSELKIVQTVFRKTYGWVEGWDRETQSPIYKVEDAISYSQFEELTGLSRASISEGIKRAVSHGLIVRVKKGNYTDMSSSSYRIRFVGEEVDAIEDIVIVEAEKPKVEEEVLSTQTPQSQKKLSPYDRYKMKKPKDYNAVDMCYYFSDKYNSVLSVWYGTVTQKDRTLMKQLITGYGADTVVKAIDWLMENYTSVVSGYPSIAVLYGFRNTVFPASQNVIQKSKNDVRQSSITEEEVQKGGDINSW